MVVSVAEKAVENNNNYNFNNKNGDVTDEECDLIQRALEMTLNDDGCSQSPKNEASNETQLKCKCISSWIIHSYHPPPF